MNNDHLEKIKKAAFWIKFTAIMTYIGAGFMFLLAIISIVTIIGAIVYGAFGTVMIFLGNHLMKASSKMSEISKASGNFDALEKMVESNSHLGSYFKITTILNIVTIVTTTALIIIAIWAFSSSDFDWDTELNSSELSYITE